MIRRNTRRWIAAAAALLLAPTAGVRADNAAFAAKEDTTVGGGAEVYGHICQGCHMPGAQGAVGAGHYPKLAGDPALVSWEYVALTVLNGRNGMPAFGEPPGSPLDFGAVRLTDAQIAGVVNYVRGNFGNHYKAAVTTNQVAALRHPGAPPPP